MNQMVPNLNARRRQSTFLTWPLRRSHVASTTCGDPINQNTVSLALCNNNNNHDSACIANDNTESPFSKGVVLVSTADEATRDAVSSAFAPSSSSSSSTGLESRLLMEGIPASRVKLG